MKSNLIPITRIYDIYPKYTYSNDVKKFMDEIVDIDRANVFTKDDMVDILTEIQMEIKEHEESIIGHYDKETKESDLPSHRIERNNGRKECVDLIQQKINELKAESESEEE